MKQARGMSNDLHLLLSVCISLDCVGETLAGQDMCNAVILCSSERADSRHMDEIRCTIFALTYSFIAANDLYIERLMASVQGGHHITETCERH